MKVIGPYVISAVPAGAAVHGDSGPAFSAPAPESGPSAWNRPDSGAAPVVDRALPLHGVDRLTGMPVLLHRLSAFLVPVTLPDSPFLLPVSEVDVWDAQPYAVTELPPAAVPADHPATAAPGVLRALAALHAAGLVHGGLNAGQFWQVGREVRLAGAGLPWTPGATPADDVRALGRALDTLGARPAALRDLETMDAAQALAALGTSPAEAPEERPAPPGPAERGPLPGVPAGPVRVRPERRDTPPAGPLPAASLRPAVSSTLSGLDAPPAPDAPQEPHRRWDDRTERQTERQGAEPDSGAARQQAAQAEPLEPDAPAASTEAALPPASEGQPTPAPTEPASPESPRIYRAVSDVIIIGEEGPSPGRATADERPGPDLSASPGAPTPAFGRESPHPESHEPRVAGAVPAQPTPAPILIGFDDLPDLPSDWASESAPREAEDAVVTDGDHPGSVSPGSPPETPAGEPEATSAGTLESEFSERPAGRVTRYTPTDARPAGGRAPHEAPAVTGDRTAGSPRQQALRIGWEEDHSWRVVKSVEDTRTPLARRPLWPLALLMLALLAGAAAWWTGRSTAPAAACCSQQFTVLGSKLPVQVTLVQAPPGSPLQAGAVIGTAPGVLNFPNIPGRYTLRFSAEGHGALTGAVTVPSSQSFSIMLK